MEELVINSKEVSLVRTPNYECDSEKFTPYVRYGVRSTKDFLNNLNSTFIQDIFPRNCRYIKKFEDLTTMYIIEEQPSIRTIRVQYDTASVVEKLKATGKLELYGYDESIINNYNLIDGRKIYNFTLSFPYVVFIILLRDRDNTLMSILPFFRNHPINSLDDYLCLANLYNIPPSQKLCIGEYNSSDQSNVIETVDIILSAFWSNSFNRDYVDNVQQYSKNNIEYVDDYLTWQYNTLKDPLFIYDVKWIPYRCTINDVINELEYNSHENLKSRGDFSQYNSFINLLRKPIIDNNLNINFNIANEILIEDDRSRENYCLIEVGDEIKLGSKLFYINRFGRKLNNQKRARYDIIEIENEKGETKILPLTRMLKRIILKDYNNRSLLQEVEVNGIKIKVGDIINVEEPIKRIRKIQKIRRNRNSQIEVLTGDDYYILDLLKFSIFDKDNIKFKGIKLNIGDEFIIFDYDEIGKYIINGLYKYDGIDQDRSDIVLKFTYDYQNKVKTKSIRYENLNSSERRIIRKEETEEVKCCRTYLGLVNNQISYLYNKMVFMNHNPRWDKNKIEDTLKEIFKSDDEILIRSFDTDINFKVGDFIVIVNWDKPEMMLKPMRIKEFVIQENLICFKLVTLNGKNTVISPYIDLETGVIHTGRFRKISLDYNGLNHGDEIKANTKNIQNFPMKDLNKIIGVIIDSQTPLVLCSNLCTIWARPEDLTRFDITKKGDKGYGRRQIAGYDLSKIKYQGGDFIQIYNKETKMNNIHVVEGFGRYKSRLLENYVRFSGYCYYDDLQNILRNNSDLSWKFYGILSPRYTRTEYNSYPRKFVMPTMLNGYIKAMVAKRNFVIRERWENYNV